MRARCCDGYRRFAAETQALDQAEREEVARQRAAALEARLGRLTLEVGTSVDLSA